MSAQSTARDDSDSTSTGGATINVTASTTADGTVHTPSVTISGLSEALRMATILTPSSDTDTRGDVPLTSPVAAVARDAGERIHSIEEWAQGLGMPAASIFAPSHHTPGESVEGNDPADEVDTASVADRTTPSSRPDVRTIDIAPPGTETVELGLPRDQNTASSRLTPEMSHFVKETKLEDWLSHFTYDPWFGDIEGEVFVRGILDPSPLRHYTMSMELELPTEMSRKTAAQFRGYLESLPGIDDLVANDIALFGQLRPFMDRYGDPEQPLGPEYDVFSNDFVFGLRSISPDKFDETIGIWEEKREIQTPQVMTKLIVDVTLGSVPSSQKYVADSPGPEV